MPHDTISSNDWDAIERYLLGQATSDETELVQRLLTQDARLAALAKTLRSTAAADEQPLVNMAALQQRIKAERAESRIRARADGQLSARATHVARSAPRLAAVGVVATLLGLAWWGRGWIRDLTTSSAAAAIPVRTVATGAGERSLVTLDDGTRILLNAESRLRIPRDVSDSRTVELDGEAQFTVVHHGNTPFIVQSGDARVRVLGTTFIVRRYPETHSTRVVVDEGRVSVGDVRTHIAGAATLSAHMLADVPDSGKTMFVTPNVDLNDYEAWTHGQLVFHEAPLRDVLPELARHYGLTIRLADTTLADQRLTATVTDDPASAILDFISITCGMRYTRDGSKVTFFRSANQAAKTRQSLSPHIEAAYGK